MPKIIYQPSGKHYPNILLHSTTIMESTFTNPQSGERLSFFGIFNQKGYSVEIPIIQRDYAQGRKTSTEVRDMFLDSLDRYLSENKPNRDLDFIYGSLTNSCPSKFIPLDGQQRLTTLFLLHWYLANISGQMPVLREFITSKNRSRFTYETRLSAREFCDAFVIHDVDLEHLLPADKGLNNSLSRTIRNAGWYYLSWDTDPTIESMLNMLDSIHMKFQGKKEYFDRLTNEIDPVITFLFLNMGELSLSDDLYIKMNSRGRPLTQWENFKAKFEQFLAEEETLKKQRMDLCLGDEIRNVTLKEYFSHMIDTVWANLFWNYRSLVDYKSNKKEGDVDDSFDDELMNFIRVLATSQFASECTNNKDEKLETLLGTQVARWKKDYSDTYTFYKYKGLEVLSVKFVNFLVSSLNALTNGEDKIKTLLPEPFYFDENKVFELVLSRDPRLTFVQRVQFYAYLKYLTENQTSVGIYEWMRVVHNLSENTVIDSAEFVARAIKSIDKLLFYSKDIIDYLKTNTTAIDFFSPVQVFEESLKAHLLGRSAAWRKTILDAEHHAYFSGQIGFILYFSGILECFKNQERCQWTIEEDNFFLRNFQVYSEKAMAVFSAIIGGLNKDFLFERAVLSKGDYLLSESSFRYNFCSVNSRDYGWKRFLRLPREDANTELFDHWKERIDYVKEVFDDPDFNHSEFIDSLKKIIRSLPGDWRDYFITNPDLIRYCSQGFIRFGNDEGSDILLFNASQRNHLHREMYTYNLFLKYLNGKSDFSPFKIAEHMQAKGSEEESHLKLHNWCHDRIYFELRVYFNPEDTSFKHPFYIAFAKSKGSQNKGDFPENIQLILQNKGYSWDDKQYLYIASAKNEQKTIQMIKDLCLELDTL